MSTVDARIAQRPWTCPWCGDTVATGDVIWPLKIGSTESSACADCSWRAENNIPLFREAP